MFGYDEEEGIIFSMIGCFPRFVRQFNNLQVGASAFTGVRLFDFFWFFCGSYFSNDLACWSWGFNVSVLPVGGGLFFFYVFLLVFLLSAFLRSRRCQANDVGGFGVVFPNSYVYFKEFAVDAGWCFNVV